MSDPRYAFTVNEPPAPYKNTSFVESVYRKGYYMATQFSAESLSKQKEFTCSDYRVLLFLLSKMNMAGYAIMPQSYISTELEMTQAQVSKSLKKLNEMTYIQKTVHNGANAYYIEDFVASRRKPQDKER